MRKISLYLILIFVVCLQACAPYYKEMRVNANPSSSRRSFVADCRQEITIRWNIANADNIGSQHISFRTLPLKPGALGRIFSRDLASDKRKYTFSFKGPVTVQLTVKQNNSAQTSHTVTLDFIVKDYYMNANLTRGDNLQDYPRLGDTSKQLDFVKFVAFYDTGEPRVIDYVKSILENPETNLTEHPFKARTNIPAIEQEAVGNNDEKIRFFKSSYGSRYPYNEVNAVVFGGAFAKSGEEIIVRGNKEEVVEATQSTTENIEQIFLEITLSDNGTWLETSTSNPNIVDVQVGNVRQGLVLHSYDNMLPGPVASLTTNGSITTANVLRQTTAVNNPNGNPRGIINGSLKGAGVGMLINTADGEWVAAPVVVGINNAKWRMPYLLDTDNLESVCGEGEGEYYLDP